MEVSEGLGGAAVSAVLHLKLEFYIWHTNSIRPPLPPTIMINDHVPFDATIVQLDIEQFEDSWPR